MFVESLIYIPTLFPGFELTPLSFYAFQHLLLNSLIL